MHAVLASILSVVWVLALAAGLRVYRRFIASLDRSRVAERIEQGGGTVIDMARCFSPIEWLFTKGSVRRYRVTYHSHAGESVTTECLTSATTGVHWAEGAPPSSPPARPNNALQLTSTGGELLQTSTVDFASLRR